MKENIQMINGNKVELIPATLEDRPRVYEWCFQSETTLCHSGAPNYPENPIPSYEEFYASDEHGYMEYYFTGTKPNAGRGYLIVHRKEPIGFISYCSFHLKPAMAELDIWIKDEANCGKGFGVDALMALSEYLNREMGIRKLIIAPSVRNTRAVRAYEKAGFEKTEQGMGEFLSEKYVSTYENGDYGVEGTAVLVKRFDC